MEKRKIVLMIAIVVVLLILSVVVTFFFLKSSETNQKTPIATTEVPFRDIVAEALAGNSLLVQVRESLLTKDYQKAILLSQQVLTISSSSDERSVAENSIGQAYFSLGEYKLGTKTYYSVFNTTSYEPTTRAAALNSIIQQYRGTLNRDILDGIIDNHMTLTNNQIYDQVYQRIYDVYPIGIASAWIGRKSLANIDRSNKEEALNVYNKHALDIDKDIEFQSKGTGSAYIIPSTLTAKANFMTYAYSRFGFSSVSEIAAVYEKAANLARANGNKITEQFTLLTYIDFLAKENEIKKAEEVFSIFATQTPEKMILQNLAESKIQNSWPGLAILYSKSNVVRGFADKYGIRP